MSSLTEVAHTHTLVRTFLLLSVWAEEYVLTQALRKNLEERERKRDERD